jgi:hypothetical protein
LATAFGGFFVLLGRLESPSINVEQTMTAKKSFLACVVIVSGAIILLIACGLFSLAITSPDRNATAVAEGATGDEVTTVMVEPAFHDVVRDELTAEPTVEPTATSTAVATKKPTEVPSTPTVVPPTPTVAPPTPTTAPTRDVEAEMLDYRTWVFSSLIVYMVLLDEVSELSDQVSENPYLLVIEEWRDEAIRNAREIGRESRRVENFKDVPPEALEFHNAYVELAEMLDKFSLAYEDGVDNLDTLALAAANVYMEDAIQLIEHLPIDTLE